MSNDVDASVLGRCPECDTEIPAGCLLVRYTSDDGWPRTFTECPGCLGVVHPI